MKLSTTYKRHPYSWLLKGIHYFLIILLTYAGVTKLLEGDRLFTNLNNAPFTLVQQLATPLSWGIPFLEILAAILLISPKLKRTGLYLSLTLFISFLLYTLGILFISPYTPCSCGGIITLLSWKAHLTLNLFLILISGIAIKYHKTT